MSAKKFFIDDGELVYYINENEFIACDEIPMPMLEGIEDLQQKVEQLENIRKEAIGYIKSVYIPELQEGHICINYKEADDLLNILNKGDRNEIN